MEEEALYIRDGDAFVGTILTQGGWDPNGANGGTVLALLGQCLDDVPTLAPMSPSRITADLVRPVPLGRRLHVESEVVREGKKIQVVELRLVVDGVDHVRVTVLRLRDVDLGGLELPRSTTDARPGDELPPPDQAWSIRELTPDVPGFMRAVDMRRARTPDGATGAWVRLHVPVIAGEPVSPSARLACAIDFANLIGLAGHPGAVTMINPDVTAHVLRPSESEWVGITGDTRFNPTLGRGVSTATLSDEDGPFAFVSTSQLIQPRPG
jgi:hypothetical protein